jgi:hypothetical protein
MRDFDRNFNRMQRVFWVAFTLVAVVILSVWIIVGVGIYTVISNPASVGNSIADIVRPVANAIKE